MLGYSELSNRYPDRFKQCCFWLGIRSLGSNLAVIFTCKIRCEDHLKYSKWNADNASNSLDDDIQKTSQGSLQHCSRLHSVAN